MSAADPHLALAEAVCALGRPEFPARFLGVLHALAGSDLCSAFEVGAQRRPQYLFAAGSHPAIPDFAETASLAYVRDFWSRDATTRRTLAQGAGAVRVVRQAWGGIADPDYRRACYERGDIGERITLYGGGPRRVIASAYRLRGSGPSRPEQLDLLQAFAAPVVALVLRHVELAENAGAGTRSLVDLVQRFLDCGQNLSQREARVAAGMMLGQSQHEISEATGIAVSSVVTYRRRAYRKLGIQDRKGLEQALIAAPKAGSEAAARVDIYSYS